VMQESRNLYMLYVTDEIQQRPGSVAPCGVFTYVLCVVYLIFHFHIWFFEKSTFHLRTFHVQT